MLCKYVRERCMCVCVCVCVFVCGRKETENEEPIVEYRVCVCEGGSLLFKFKNITLSWSVLFVLV